MKIQTLLLAIFLSLTIVPTARGQSSLEKVVITYPSRSIASVDLYIAQERGFFAKKESSPTSCKSGAISA